MERTDLNHVSVLLDDERRVLEQIRADLHLGRRAGSDARIGTAALARIDRRRTLLRLLELQRAIAVEAALAALGDDPDARSRLPRLSGLAGMAPAPWSSVLSLHARELRGLIRVLDRLEATMPVPVGTTAPRSLRDFVT